MKEQRFIFVNFFILLFLTVNMLKVFAQTPSLNKKPNVVIIFLDDAGWADFELFNKSINYTPNIQKLTLESKVFPNFYVPQAVCSASRAAMLTGCYPGRTKMFGAIAPHEAGLDRKFRTMGEIFESQGYRTALFGKWHIGDTDGHRPWDRGFQRTAGLLYSHDMWKNHPEDPDFWGKYPLQFFEDGKVLIPNMDIADVRTLTKRYTDYAVDFIHENKDNPFLLYVPHNMPHVPIYASKQFEAKSGMGPYADVIMELDWSIGQISNALKAAGVEQNTIFILTSDNGPWLSYGNHAGKTPFREGKTTSFNGGIKSGMLIKYPNLIRGGTFSNATLFSIDLLPTLAELAHVSLKGNEVDGKSMVGMLKGNVNFKNPHKFYAVSNLNQLQAIISGDGRWKLHVAHPYKSIMIAGADSKPGKYEDKNIELSLFDLLNDPFESHNLAKTYPEVTKRLLGFYNEQHNKFYKNRN